MRSHTVAGTIFVAGALAAAGASAQGSGAGSGASATPPGPVDSATGTSSSPSDNNDASSGSSSTKPKRGRKRAKAQGRSSDTNGRSSRNGEVVPGKATTDAHGVPVRQDNPIDDQAKAGKLAGPMTDTNTDRDAGSSTGDKSSNSDVQIAPGSSGRETGMGGSQEVKTPKVQR